VERRTPIHDVSEILGHSQVETTLRMYVHTEAGAAAPAAASTRGCCPPSA
jgi:integrase